MTSPARFQARRQALQSAAQVAALPEVALHTRTKQVRIYSGLRSLRQNSTSTARQLYQVEADVLTPALRGESETIKNAT